jgi:taurine dioxygenase
MTTTTADFTVTPLGGTLGARIDGVRLADGFDQALVDRLREALDEHLVIFLPGQQDLTPGQQLELAGMWGEIAVHPYVPSIEGFPGIMRIYDPNELTTVWHEDTTHMARPPLASILLAREIPSRGGDTMWANEHLAYERLSAGLQATLDGLDAVHEGTTLAGSQGLTHEQVTTAHPVVVRHDRTGRKALFVNANYTTRFAGWTEEESAPLLRYLYAQACRPEITWRHHWTVGDLLIWDNIATQHAVVGDAAPGEPRTLHRVTIGGTRPHR